MVLLSSDLTFILGLPVKKLAQQGDWADVEERMILRIKATLPDAEFPLQAMEGFGDEGERVREQSISSIWVTVGVYCEGTKQTAL